MSYDVLMPAPGMPIIAERIATRATLHRPFLEADPAAAVTGKLADVRELS